VLSLSPPLRPCLPVELIICHSALIGLSELCKSWFPDRLSNQTLMLTCTHKNRRAHPRTRHIHRPLIFILPTKKKTLISLRDSRTLAGERIQRTTVLVLFRGQMVRGKSEVEAVYMLHCRALLNMTAFQT